MEGREEVWEGLILGKLMTNEFDILCRVRKNLRYSGIDTYVLPPLLPQHSSTYSLESPTNSYLDLVVWLVTWRSPFRGTLHHKLIYLFGFLNKCVQLSHPIDPSHSLLSGYAINSTIGHYLLVERLITDIWTIIRVNYHCAELSKCS